MSRFHSDRIRSRAALHDDSGIVILGLVLLAIFSSFSAIFGLLFAVKAASSQAKLFYVALAAGTIFISWMVMQVVFTLHYAHQYYAAQSSSQGGIPCLDFPNDAHPDYWDFLYFATSIGATSQTSDVSINSKELRRLVTLHAIVSFFFNAAVLALTINLAASIV
jgi:uncharacterized membrane protein